jgi:alpha-amylase
MERHAGRELFVVAEYWTADLAALEWFLNRLGRKITLFGVPLHYRFHTASRSSGQFDMRGLLDNTLMRQRDQNVVTFVENHDSQPLQALESVVESWFKPLAYAVILLRREGYPCVFHADYYGAEYEDVGRDGQRYRITLPSHRSLIDKFLHARRHFAYGAQRDYLDQPSCVGWTRLGDDEHPRAMAVLMSDGQPGAKWMDVSRPNARFIDITEHDPQQVVTNSDGWGEFRCLGGSVSVWVQE